MLNKKNKFILGIVFVVIGAFGWLKWPFYQKAVPINVYSLIDKKFVDLPEEANEPALIIFWNTWCGPCKIEMRRLQNSIIEGKIPSGKVYAISMGEPVKTIESFVLEHEYAFQFFVDTESKNLQTYKVPGTPTTYHFNRHHQVIWAATGLDPLSIQRAEKLFAD